LKVSADVKNAMQCFQNFGGGGKCPKYTPWLRAWVQAILIHLPLATLEMAIQTPSLRHLKNGSPSLHLMISSNTELMLIVNRWAVAKYLTTNKNLTTKSQAQDI